METQVRQFWSDTGNAISINHQREAALFLHYNKLLQNQTKANNKHQLQDWNMANKRKEATTTGALSIQLWVMPQAIQNKPPESAELFLTSFTDVLFVW